MDSDRSRKAPYSQEAPIPTYEESVEPNAVKKVVPSKSQSLAERLAQVQRNRIEKLIEQHIDPLLSKHADSGLFKASFALIFSDVSLLQHGCDGVGDGDTLLKFPDDEYTCVVRLHGDENTSRFWQQTAVTEAIQVTLSRRLGVDNEQEQDVAASIKAQAGSNSTGKTPNTSRKWAFFGKQNQSRASVPTVIPKFSQAGAGWRAEVPYPIDTSQTTLHVRCEEVFVRVRTDLGLYQTRSCPAVVIRLNVGH